MKNAFVRPEGLTWLTRTDTNKEKTGKKECRWNKDNGTGIKRYGKSLS